MSVQADGSGNKPVTTTGTGLAKDTGTPVSIAPTKPAPPDDVSQVRNPSRAGLGQNGFTHASSLAPGEMMRSPLAESIGTDPILDSIVKSGTARSNTTGETMAPQTRDVGKSGLPDAMGMESSRSRQPSSAGFSTIPTTLQRDSQSPSEIAGTSDPASE